MSEWKKVPIKDVCVGIYDGPHATPPVSETGGIFLGISNITKDGHFDFSSIKYIGDDYMPKWTKRVTPQKDDIVFSYEATLNLYAVIPDGFYGCLGRRMALIRTNKQLVNHKYLFYYFFSKNWRNLISEKTIVGATVDRIPIATFPDFEIELPSLDVQNKIATILSRYDSLIENYQKQIKLLEESAQRLYKEWFIDLRFPGHENTKIVDGVPEGWEKKKLVDMVDVQYGYAFDGKLFNSNSEGMPILRIRNIPEGITSDYTTEEASADYVVHNGDIVVGMDGIFHINTWSGGDAYLVQRACSFRPIEEVIKGFIFLAIKEPIKYFEQTLVGSTVAHLGKKHIDSIEILVPNRKELFKSLQDIFNQRQNMLYQIRHLTEARDRLLPKLMSEEIKIN